jgi:hypothetical protein
VHGEERWQVIGRAGVHSVLVVAHVVRSREEDEVVRIISARYALKHERHRYEPKHTEAKRAATVRIARHRLVDRVMERKRAHSTSAGRSQSRFSSSSNERYSSICRAMWYGKQRDEHDEEEDECDERDCHARHRGPPCQSSGAENSIPEHLASASEIRVSRID